MTSYSVWGELFSRVFNRVVFNKSGRVKVVNYLAGCCPEGVRWYGRTTLVVCVCV